MSIALTNWSIAAVSQPLQEFYKSTSFKMAICKFGTVITIGVGKLGGHVFQRARHGVAVRTGHSSNGNTFFSDKRVQNLFEIARQRWQDVPRVDRNQWAVVGRKLPIPDWDGDNRYLTGRQFHDRATIRAIQGGAMAILDPFDYENQVPVLNVDSVSVISSAQFLGVSNNGTPVTYDVRLSARFGLPSEGNEASSVFFNVGVHLANNGSPTTSYINLVNALGQLSAGQQLTFKVIRTTSEGVSSLPVYLASRVQ